MFHKSFVDLGISPGYGFKQLLFCPSANALVVQAQSATSSWRPDRLYFRQVTAERYDPVGTDYLFSQEDPVLAPSRPVLAYRANVHSFALDAAGVERHSAKWDSIRVFDLHARAETCVVSARTIQFPDGVTNGWISGLLAFAENENGDVLHVVAGLSRNGDQSMDYYLSELNLQTLAVRASRGSSRTLHVGGA
jgi:hypothetical protein